MLNVKLKQFLWKKVKDYVLSLFRLIRDWREYYKAILRYVLAFIFPSTCNNVEFGIESTRGSIDQPRPGKKTNEKDR